MKNLLATLLVAGSAQAATYTDSQVEEFCRMVDPMFLKTLPVLLEAKAAGKELRHAISLFMRSAYTLTDYNGGGALYIFYRAGWLNDRIGAKTVQLASASDRPLPLQGCHLIAKQHERPPPPQKHPPLRPHPHPPRAISVAAAMDGLGPGRALARFVL